ncbi:MAG: family phage terminase large subunit [Thermoanaerobacter sp.]|jgi:PBSX family phage terminase large subunit|nr:family phage terminase large subunit [Thermoanaerobacter sp.]
MKLSPKQKEFWNNANHRWNIKTGATRSGKTYLDYFLIPKRIRATKGQGLIVLLGNTRGTLERNILDPMRQIYGNKLVGNISSDNTVILFGKKVYALGADKRNQVARIQGAGIEYCYGDEITTWSEEVFQMLKSRLDKPNSCFDGTCNPDHPKHWFKQFLDSDADIYHQHYTIDDNPFLDPFFVEQLKKEYAGTVYYDRFILGKWTRAEGVIYKLFADDPERYEISIKEAKEKVYQEIDIGVDFGGNKSKHAFVATGITPKYKEVVVLISEKHNADVDPEELNKLFINFVKRVMAMYGRVDYVYPDSAEQVLIRGFKTEVSKEGLNIIIRDAKKIEIKDRIRLVSALISQGRFFYTKDAYTVRDALCEAVWDESKNEDVRLDDGTTDIDTLDALEYSIERDARRFMRVG